jgi:hypothetical protein
VDKQSGSEKTEHVPDSRLFFIAMADNLDFKLEEYNHMKDCQTCLQQWKKYLDDRTRREDQSKEPTS